MRLGATIISILMIYSLSLIGCSKENPAAINKKAVVKRPIAKPPEEKNTKQTASVEQPAQSPEINKVEEIKKTETGEEKVYIAKGDESLSKIAAGNDVYGDPLKWILLYRFNREAFNNIAKDESFHEKYVPAETRLKIVPPGDIKTTLENDAKDHWVINVLSSPEEKLVVADAVRLIDNGYPAYITSANVKGQDYIRLRVGFYDDKAAAEDEGRKISEMFNVSDLWTTRAGETEYKEFGGYR